MTGAQALILNYQQLAPATGGEPQSVVILLHGVGDRGAGLIDLGEFWCKALPETEFIAPDGPYPFDGAPYGRQWFSLLDRNPVVIRQGVESAAIILNQFIDEVLSSRNLSPKALALVGFSQGTMMGLYVGTRRVDSIAGIVGYSGRLSVAETLPLAKPDSPPVLLIHGEADEVVPHSELSRAEAYLAKAGYSVETLSRPRLGHTIDKTGLDAGLQHLRRVLLL